MRRNCATGPSTVNASGSNVISDSVVVRKKLVLQPCAEAVFDGNTTFNGSTRVTGTLDAVRITVDTIDEHTLNHGVIVENVLLKDGAVQSGSWQGSTIAPGRGGTGLTSYTPGDLIVATAPTTLASLPAGPTGFVLTSSGPGVPPTWTGGSGSGVSSFSAGTTGFTPSVPTTGAVVLGGTVNVAHGGTGTTSLPAGSILYGNGTSPVGTTVGSPGQLLVSNAGLPPSWSSVAYNGSTITSVPNPINSSDVANKAYVDAAVAGLTVHDAARLATTGNLTSTYNNGAAGVGATLTNAGPMTALSVDGTLAMLGDRILVKNQADPTQNGVYDVTNVGSGATNWVLTRSSDFDNSPPNEIQPGDFVFVTDGLTLGNTGWTQIETGTGPGNSIIVGTDPIEFAQFSGAGTYLAGTGLNLVGNTFNNTGVLSVSGGASGLTFSPTTGNAILAGGILIPAFGGTGNTTNTSTNSTITDLTTPSTYYPVFVDSSGTGSKPLDINSASLRFIASAIGNSITIGNSIAFGTTSGSATAPAPAAIAIGKSASTGTVAATNNIMIGENAGNSSMSGTLNTAMGSSVLLNNTTGSNNSAFGSGSLQFNTIGGLNSAFGSEALYDNTTGQFNTACGGRSLQNTTIGNNLTAVGTQALQLNTTGSDSIAVGYNALRSNLTGNQSVAVGTNALTLNTVGQNTAVGFNALSTSTSGFNTAVGHRTGLNITTGSRNTGIGAASLLGCTTGVQNTAVGQGTLSSIAGGVSNVAVGNDAMLNAVGVINSVAIGDTALNSLTTGLSNSGVGQSVLLGLTTGNNNCAFGVGAGSNLTNGNNNILIGPNSNCGANASGGIAIGLFARIGVAAAVSSIVIGSTAGNNTMTGAFNVAIGQNVLNSNTTGANNTILGNSAFIANTTGNNNVAVGRLAQTNNTIGGENVAIGVESLLNNIDGSQNTAVGKNALFLNTTGSQNTGIGCYAGYSITTGINNTIIGNFATADATNDNTVVVGQGAFVSANNSISIGTSVGNAVANSALIGVNADPLARFEVPGTVTQITSLTTGVTNNTAQGKITLFSSIGATTAVRFTVTNNRVRAASVIRATVEGVGGTAGLPTLISIMSVSAGTFDFVVYNPDASATTTSPIVHYDVLYPAL